VTEEREHLGRIQRHLVRTLRGEPGRGGEAKPGRGGEAELAQGHRARREAGGAGKGRLRATGPQQEAGPGSGAAAPGSGGRHPGEGNSGRQASEDNGEQLRFDDDLIELRDEVIEAKAEDVAPLAEQMMRVAAIRAARGQGARADLPADPRSPYFGHLQLSEQEQERDVFIGKRTYVDTRAGVVIVDWRNAPISSLYYRYEEGDDYEELIAGRRREGVVTARRTLSVVDGELRRIRSPQGTFVREGDEAGFRLLAEDPHRLQGGQGTALRPKGPAFVSHREKQRRQRQARGVRPGVRPDKHLPEISALLDPEQFRLITSGDSGLLVLTGGAGSGKTTIGLHRIAFLAFQHPKRYRPEQMMVLVPGQALANYVSRVLPDLGLPGVPVRTLSAWLLRQRKRILKQLKLDSAAEDVESVRQVKKHPDLLGEVDALADERRAAFGAALHQAVEGLDGSDVVRDAWMRVQQAPVAQQLRALLDWCRKPVKGGALRLPSATLVAVEAVTSRELPAGRELLSLWAELITDRGRLGRLGQSHGKPLPEDRLSEAVAHCALQTSAVLDAVEAREHGERVGPSRRDREEPDSILDDPEADDGYVPAYLSPEDDALLLRLHQQFVGELPGRTGRRLTYAHLLVDEVQDLSVVELAVVLRCAARDGSVTLAGDPAQRMVFDTGYRGWEGLLTALGLDTVSIAPLQIGYRSTAEIQRFAQAVLGPRWSERAPAASRAGVPVEAFHFGDPGEAVVFLADALRELSHQEPLASVALIARYPAQAETYYQALRKAEVPGLRRVVEQDFSFAPGIEVTDVRQVKGLEFDYVLLLDVNAESYPDTTESRHLLHVAATRAAHQLWLIVPGQPSRVLQSLSTK